MKALLQRVTTARVEVDGEKIAAIGAGVLVFLGVERGDTQAQARQLAERVVHYRMLADADGRMNLSVRDLDAQLLVVPQFTLAADTHKGRRPSFTPAAEPERGLALYRVFLDACGQWLGVERVRSGRFGADMQVSLVNDGPVTFWLEVPVAVDTVA